MLSKKYYKAIAEVIDRHQTEIINTATRDGKLEKMNHKLDALHDIAYALSRLFMDDNPNFDRERFLKACGINQ